MNPEIIYSLSEPADESVLLAAVRWLEHTLLGTLATTVAIIAVAALGFMLLAGRVDYRRGATVIMGCFVLFGASAIAAGIQSAQSAIAGNEISPEAEVARMDPPPPPVTVPPQLPSYDPYAGASVPRF
ncbi:TrbC/VirB2 family protein [Sphingobium lignivorans]|uniref:Type IV secretory pathway VirB2 component (Pilin) n=1 Tax=Sphingobium lignivorans TaxID=2735886 RepID=A0ABR6NH84_9SPHN|nr:TrbC/VirB2 family protein [Sphingobium lignivorans]MBB5986642.1 type IV secretory pathway VirB2 component (pilin) [Sphingobium lignivorans]